MEAKSVNVKNIRTGQCPNCDSKLFYPVYDKSVECSFCSHRIEVKTLKNVGEVSDVYGAITSILRNILRSSGPKRGAESVSVRGLSNYQCKLLSPFFTSYGVDRSSGEARPLAALGRGPLFDCAALGDRTFLIEPELVDFHGYGRDRTGSVAYLGDTLDCIRQHNDDQERLVPIHADGDGHCLVHAVSKALVGRELFWHPLRENLKNHFTQKISQYRQYFGDFIDADEWNEIVAECDPDYSPESGEQLGLRNIHIFGLANVLRRPIFLLDSLQRIHSSGDYTGLFLPLFQRPQDCRSKDGKLNRPLCLAWSSAGHNHYIAVVPIKGMVLPRLPADLVPKVWAPGTVDNVGDYLVYESDGTVLLGGEKALQESYIMKLVTAMEKVFIATHGLSTELVADFYHYTYKSAGYAAISVQEILAEAKRAMAENSIYRCFHCRAIQEFDIDGDMLRPDGVVYKMAEKVSNGALREDKLYTFISLGIAARYNKERDEFVVDMNHSHPPKCSWCRQPSTMRHVTATGAILYHDGDRTTTPAQNSVCGCGFKHFWEGREFRTTLEWSGQQVQEQVVWFQYESDPSLNSNVFEVAQRLVHKHFPGEFGSERLVQNVVDKILRSTARKEAAEKPVCHSKEDEGGDLGNRPSPEGAEDPVKVAAHSQAASAHPETDTAWRDDTSSKIILSGGATKSLHREELVMNETERQLRRRIEAKAAAAQKRAQENRAQVQQSRAAATRAHAQQSQTRAQQNQTRASKKDPSLLQTPSSTIPKSVQSTETAPLNRPATSGTKRIRIQTSDGKQSVLVMDNCTTFHQLTERISSQIGVAPSRLRLRVGVPPRLLQEPQDPSAPVAIDTGDRLTVEVVPDTTEQRRQSRTGESRLSPTKPAPAWPDSKGDGVRDAFERLYDTDGGALDDIDTAVATLSLVARISNKDLWTYAQTMPHLFRAGGCFYKQVVRDLSPSHHTHLRISALPEKVFRFNQHLQQLELCLEPFGHFAVEDGVEQKVVAGGVQELESVFRSNPASRDSPTTTPFSGQGHSMLDAAAATVDDVTTLTKAIIGRASRSAQEFCADMDDVQLDMDDEEDVTMKLPENEIDPESLKDTTDEITKMDHP